MRETPIKTEKDEVEKRFTTAISNLGGVRSDTIEHNGLKALTEKQIERQAFHAMSGHGLQARDRVVPFLSEDVEGFEGFDKKTKLAIESMVDLIGINHDAIYHIDGKIAPEATTILEQVFKKNDDGQYVFDEGNAKKLCPVVYEMAVELNKFSDNSIFRLKPGLSGPGPYGNPIDGGIAARGGTGENELFSAVIHEITARQSGMDEVPTLITTAAIINTVFSTSELYQNEVRKIVNKMVFDRIDDPSVQKYGGIGVVSRLARDIDHAFTNRFDIMPYAIGMRLAANSKYMDTEQTGKPLLEGMELAARSLDNFFHMKVLKPGIDVGRVQIFLGKDAVEMNKKAIKGIEFEAEFRRTRAVGAFIGQLFPKDIDDKLPQQDLALSKTRKDIIKVLEAHNEPGEGYKTPQGYKTDAIGALMLKRLGPKKIEQIAKKLDEIINKAKISDMPLTLQQKSEALIAYSKTPEAKKFIESVIKGEVKGEVTNVEIPVYVRDGLRPMLQVNEDSKKAKNTSESVSTGDKPFKIIKGVNISEEINKTIEKLKEAGKENGKPNSPTSAPIASSKRNSMPGPGGG
jgi:hypothetical protein